jgi:hypothetical protein
VPRLRLFATLRTFPKALKILKTNRVRNYDKENVEDTNRNTRKSSLYAIIIRKCSKFLTLVLLMWRIW